MLALGLASARPDRKVIAFNGDGCMLMSLGCLVTIVASGAAQNLTLVVLENGVYEVTGGQHTAGGGLARVDFVGAARASGLRDVARFTDLNVAAGGAERGSAGARAGDGTGSGPRRRLRTSSRRRDRWPSASSGFRPRRRNVIAGFVREAAAPANSKGRAFRPSSSLPQQPIILHHADRIGRWSPFFQQRPALEFGPL